MTHSLWGGELTYFNLDRNSVNVRETPHVSLSRCLKESLCQWKNLSSQCGRLGIQDLDLSSTHWNLYIALRFSGLFITGWLTVTVIPRAEKKLQKKITCQIWHSIMTERCACSEVERDKNLSAHSLLFHIQSCPDQTEWTVLELNLMLTSTCIQCREEVNFFITPSLSKFYFHSVIHSVCLIVWPAWRPHSCSGKESILIAS